MQPVDFFKVYTISAALITILLIEHILYMMYKMDRVRLFFNEAVMQRTWLYISIAGASFALYALVKFASKTVLRTVLILYSLYDLTQLIFLVAVILAVYNWYVFVRSFVKE